MKVNQTTAMSIGTHIHKRGKFVASLEAFYNDEANKGRPCQIFSGSPKFWKRPNTTAEEQAEVHKYVTSADPPLDVFVHSIYLINLCWTPDTFAERALPCLQWELRNGQAMGFKGVVVHCGKKCKMTDAEAAKNMLFNMRKALAAATPECPLLLETSAGQGTETCSTFEQFKDFYSLFDFQERQKLRICIDTCHVFAAGHDPLTFLIDWEKAFPGSLTLVHFNDSQEECGCKKDRHARPGAGKIGLDKMTEIAKWCIARTVPMVME